MEDKLLTINNQKELLKILDSDSTKDSKYIALKYIIDNEFSRENIEFFFSKPLLKNVSNSFVNYVINELYKETNIKINKFEYKDSNNKRDKNSIYDYIKYRKYKQYIIRNLNTIKPQEIIDFLTYNQSYSKRSEIFKKKLIGEYIKNNLPIPLEILKITDIKYNDNKYEIFDYIIKSKDEKLINYIVREYNKIIENHVLKNNINDEYVNYRLLSENVEYYKNIENYKNKKEILLLYFKNIYEKYTKSINNIKNNPYEYKNYELIIKEYEKCIKFSHEFINQMYEIDKEFINIFITANMQNLKVFYKLPEAVNILQYQLINSKEKENKINNKIITNNIKALFDSNDKCSNLIYSVLTYDAYQDLSFNENLLNVFLKNINLLTEDQKKEIVIELIRPYFTHVEIEKSFCLNYIEKVGKAITHFDYDLIKEINKYYINPKIKYIKNILKQNVIQNDINNLLQFEKVIQSAILLTELKKNTKDNNNKIKCKI